MFSNPQPFFESIDDPRRDNKNKIHKLWDIIFIVLAATMSGIEEWAGMEMWAKYKEDWLRQYIELPNGIPSHDTLNAVMNKLNPRQFNVCFTKWVQTDLSSLAGLHIAVDGKTLRGSRDEETPVHMVSAFAAQARVVLTQQACDGKSNEITTIPDVLSLLELKGTIVTSDAMGCQKAIAQQVVDAEADYVFALKENQPILYAEAQSFLDAETTADCLPIEDTVDQAHGRLEIRSYALSTELDKISKKSEWAGLAAIGVVKSLREIKGEISVESRYFITSITDPIRFQEVVRAHWSIENSQHWVLDVQFREDQNRTRKDNAAANFAIIRRMSLNMARRNSKDKLSISKRKLRASLDDSFRTQLLFGT